MSDVKSGMFYGDDRDFHHAAKTKIRQADRVLIMLDGWMDGWMNLHASLRDTR